MAQSEAQNRQLQPGQLITRIVKSDSNIRSNMGQKSNKPIQSG